MKNLTLAFVAALQLAYAPIAWSCDTDELCAAKSKWHNATRSKLSISDSKGQIVSWLFTFADNNNFLIESDVEKAHDGKILLIERPLYGFKEYPHRYGA